MQRLNVERSREIRLWIRDLVIPAALITGAILSNAEIRGKIRRGFYSVEDKIHEFKNSRKKHTL